MASGVNRPITTSAIGVKYLHFRVDGTSTRSLLEGTSDAVLSGSTTGIYVLTLNEASRRAPIIVGAATNTVDARFSASFDSTFKILTITWEVGGTDTDVDFHVTVAVFNTPDAN